MLYFDHPTAPQPFPFLAEEKLPSLPTALIHQQAVERISVAFPFPAGYYFFDHCHSYALFHLFLAHMAISTHPYRIATIEETLPAHRQALAWIERCGGQVLTVATDRDGHVDPAAMASLEDISLLSLPNAQALTGLLQPVDSLAKLDIPLHLDISAAPSHLPKECRYITCCGSDLHGPPSALIWASEEDGEKLSLPVHLPEELDIRSLHLLSLAAKEWAQLAIHRETELVHLANLLAREVNSFAIPCSLGIHQS